MNNNLKAVAIIFAVVGILSGLLGFVNLAEAQCGGSTCGEVPLTCSPQHQNGQIGTSFSFTAEGGDGNFSWSAPGSNVMSGSAQNFSTSYSSSGYKTVYVYSGTQTKTCTVTVEAPVIETHKACVSNACTIVSGPGPNTCSVNSDCVVVPPPPPSCDFPGALTGSITSYSGAQSSATVTNHSACTKTVTLATYEVFIEPGTSGWLDTQVLHDYQTVTLSAGQTKQLTADNASCRTQIDLYEGQVQPHLSDAAGGFPGQNLLDYKFTSNPLCGVVPTLSCNPVNQTVNISQSANFSATGGTGTYSWSASLGSPAIGGGVNFSTSYISSGNKTVTVSSGNQTKTCNVSVNEPPVPTLFCNPANQTVGINSAANFTATGGTGTYSWSASGGSPSSGSAQNFSTSYSTSGNKLVTVTSGSQTKTCTVAVNPPVEPPLFCNPVNQSVLIGSTANFTATGGTGTYNWSSGDGSPSTGSGSNFSTAYNTAGTRTVIVSSGSQTANCNVVVNEPPTQTLFCNPQNQSVFVNSAASFTATGGNGTYNWSSNDGSPSTGNGSNFSTSYSSVGARTVTVSSAGQTATCSVVVNTPPQNTLTCSPQSQSGYVWTNLNFSATGGNGTFSWFTNDGSPSVGNGSTFSTQFFNTGLRTVIVSSAGQTATCNVVVNQQPPQNNLTCNPQNQSANINDSVNFSATGGNGNYSWNAPDAQTTYGNSQNFTTRFYSVGSKNVTVTSNGQTATCYANINAISGNNTSFQLTKNVLNKTLNQTSYVNSTEAQSGDLVEFEIRVRNSGNTNAEVTLKDLLPTDLNYISGSATVNNSYLNDAIVNYNGISLGNIYPGEEKVIRLRAIVRPNVPAVTITNQAVAIMNSNTQNAFATIQLRNRGQVLGAADIVTGPEDVMPWVLSLGLMASSLMYFYFFYSRPDKRKVSFAVVNVAEKSEAAASQEEERGVFRAVRPKTEIDSLLSAIKKAESTPDA